MESRPEASGGNEPGDGGIRPPRCGAVRYAAGPGDDRRIRALSQLITVPKEYETAMDMVLGAAQQHIVTEDEETAKELIDYLRKNQLGRATFLPVTTVRGRA